MTLIAKLCHYILEDQRDWDILVQPLLYPYNIRVNPLTWTALLTTMLSKNPPRSCTFDGPSALLTDISHDTVPSVLPSKLLHCIAVMQQKTDKKLCATQGRYKDHHHSCVCDTPSFRPRQWVYANLPLLAVM